MAAKPFLFKPLFYSVALAGALMIPAALLMWWFAESTDYFGGEDADRVLRPDIYLKRAAATVFIIGTVIVSGAAAFAKKLKAGRYLLIAGCTAAPALSVFPLMDVFEAVSAVSAAVITAGWLIFAAPFIVLAVLVSTEKRRVHPGVRDK